MSIGDQISNAGRQALQLANTLLSRRDMDERVTFSDVSTDAGLFSAKIINDASAMGDDLNDDEIENLNNSFVSGFSVYRDRASSIKNPTIRKAATDRLDAEEQRTAIAMNSLANKAAISRGQTSFVKGLQKISQSTLETPLLLRDTFRLIDNSVADASAPVEINGSRVDLFENSKLTTIGNAAKGMAATTAFSTLLSEGREEEAWNLFFRNEEAILDAVGADEHARLKKSLKNSLDLKRQSENLIPKYELGRLKAEADNAARKGSVALMEFMAKPESQKALQNGQFNIEDGKRHAELAEEADKTIQIYTTATLMGANVNVTSDMRPTLEHFYADEARVTFLEVSKETNNPILAFKAAIRSIEDKPNGWIPPQGFDFLVSTILSKEFSSIVSDPAERSAIASRVYALAGKDREFSDARMKDPIKSRELRALQYVADGYDFNEVRSIMDQQSSQNPADIEQEQIRADEWNGSLEQKEILEHALTDAAVYNVFGRSVGWKIESKTWRKLSLGRDIVLTPEAEYAIDKEWKKNISIGMESTQAYEHAVNNVIKLGKGGVDIYTEGSTVKIEYKSPMSMMSMSENAVNGLLIQVLAEAGIIDLAKNRFIGNEMRGPIDYFTKDNLISRIDLHHSLAANGEHRWSIAFDGEVVSLPDGRGPVFITESKWEKYRGAHSWRDAMSRDPDRVWADSNWIENDYDRLRRKADEIQIDLDTDVNILTTPPEKDFEELLDRWDVDALREANLFNPEFQAYQIYKEWTEGIKNTFLSEE